jgi:hypothetical protein
VLCWHQTLLVHQVHNPLAARHSQPRPFLLLLLVVVRLACLTLLPLLQVDVC